MDLVLLSPYKNPCSKALGKDGILVSHEQTVMHHHAAERADLFIRNCTNSDERIFLRLMKEKQHQLVGNRQELHQKF